MTIDLSQLFLALAGFVAGLIDSIAGGGGLITLPVLTQALEPGAHAIGTNKIVGTTGALVAFLVYLRNQKLNPSVVFKFIFGIAVGSFLGSRVTPVLPKEVFRYLLIMVCPLILVLIWKKDSVIQEVKSGNLKKHGNLVLTGLGVGFYDGFFGPGGGTFMLLGLMWVGRLPLIESLLVSKLANTASAGTSLISYAAQGYVHWSTGLLVALGMGMGGYIGARWASKRAEKIVKPVLTLVVIALMTIQVYEIWSHSV